MGLTVMLCVGVRIVPEYYEFVRFLLRRCLA